MRDRIRTPHQRPHAREQVDGLGPDALRVGARAEGRVVGGRGEIDCGRC